MVKNNPVPALFDIQCIEVKPTGPLLKLMPTSLGPKGSYWTNLPLRTSRSKMPAQCQLNEILKALKSSRMDMLWARPEDFSDLLRKRLLMLPSKLLNKKVFSILLNEKLTIIKNWAWITFYWSQTLSWSLRHWCRFRPRQPRKRAQFGRCYSWRYKRTKSSPSRTPDCMISSTTLSWERNSLETNNSTIGSAEAVIPQGQETLIAFESCSKEEAKLKTSASLTDIILEILEGQSLQIFNKLTINALPMLSSPNTPSCPLTPSTLDLYNSMRLEIVDSK